WNRSDLHRCGRQRWRRAFASGMVRTRRSRNGSEARSAHIVRRGRYFGESNSMSGGPRLALSDRPATTQTFPRRAAAVLILLTFAGVAGLTALRATAAPQTPVPRNLYFLHGRIYT